MTFGSTLLAAAHLQWSHLSWHATPLLVGSFVPCNRWVGTVGLSAILLRLLQTTTTTTGRINGHSTMPFID
jgi:hypothetical protein